MPLAEILAEARKRKPKFSSYGEYIQWRDDEAVKFSAQVNRMNDSVRREKSEAEMNLPRVHQGCSFDNYILSDDPEQLNALRVSKYYAENFEAQLAAGRNMIFSGNSGCGKNHLASAIVQSVCQQGYSASLVSVSNLMAKFRESYNRDSNVTEAGVFNYYQNIDLLVLDEIGISHGSNDEKVQINRLIDARVNNVKCTILLSNEDARGIEKWIGFRAYDRMLANEGPMINFTWESFRRKRVK